MMCRWISCAMRSRVCGGDAVALEHWLRLSLTEGIGPILIRRIVDAAGDVEAACAAPVSLLRNVEGIGSSKAAAIHASMREALVEEEMERCERLSVSLI